MPLMAMRGTAWAIIREIQQLLTGGMSRIEVVQALRRPSKLEVAPGQFIERRALSSATAYRYVDRAFRVWKHAHGMFDRDAELSQAAASRDRAARMALTTRRHLVVDGVIESVIEPDVKTYLAALESRAKLLGLNAPERVEMTNVTVDNIFRIVCEAVRDEIEDHSVVARILTRVQAAVESSAQRIDRELKGDDFRIVEQKALPPSTNGHAPS